MGCLHQPGWFSYCAIESFGSIGVSLFWAFVNSTIDLEGAKRAYGLIIAGAQIGSILGPSLVIRAHAIGVPTLYFCGALCMLLMVVSIFIYVQVRAPFYPMSLARHSHLSNKKRGYCCLLSPLVGVFGGPTYRGLELRVQVMGPRPLRRRRRKRRPG